MKRFEEQVAERQERLIEERKTRQGQGKNKENKLTQVTTGYLRMDMGDRKVIGLTVAMDKELGLFINNFKPVEKKIVAGCEFYRVDAFRGFDVIIVKSGIGKVNAAVATTLLIEMYKPVLVISTGVCGSLSRDYVSQDDVFITNTVMYHDVWCGHDNEYGRIQGMPKEYRCVTKMEYPFVKAFTEKWMKKYNRRVWWGTTLSGDWFVDEEEKAENILANFPEVGSQVSVDMETGAIAQACLRFGVKCVSIRIISDGILAPRTVYEKFWKQVSNHIYDMIMLIFKDIQKLI